MPRARLPEAAAIADGFQAASDRMAVEASPAAY